MTLTEARVSVAALSSIDYTATYYSFLGLAGITYFVYAIANMTNEQGEYPRYFFHTLEEISDFLLVRHTPALR